MIRTAGARHRFLSGLFVAFLALTAARAAHAEIQKSGPENFPGKNELAVHMGFQSGLGSYGTYVPGTPGGFKLMFDYSYHLKDMVWLNFGVNFVLGSGCDVRISCGFGSDGNTVEPFGGVKIKFATPIPLVPYAKADANFIGIYNRFCSDNGFALAVRAGGGATYFLLPNLGVGADLGFTLGPAFYNGASNCGNPYVGHDEFYAAFDFTVGGEFIF